MDKLYLDIETTGLSRKNHEVTVVGAYDGEEIYQLVKDRDLDRESLCRLLSQADELVTYNGKKFDIPFLKHNFSIPDGFEHRDLMYLCWKLDWYGGLKKVERKLGIGRSSGVENGSQAVQLWKKYKEEGHNKSLKRLLKYNREDVTNLAKIERKVEKRL